jgi:hypothetical protein
MELKTKVECKIRYEWNTHLFEEVKLEEEENICPNCEFNTREDLYCYNCGFFK